MKAKELMIGDWVQIKGHLDYDKVQEIAMDSNMQWYISFACSATLFRAYEFAPIPLTEEILKKNGFVLVDDDLFEREINAGHSIQYDILHCHFDEYTENGYEEPIDEHNFHCELVSEVHELQHALRLCGLNDLADNFKV